MNVNLPTHSTAARERILSLPREPLFIADWTGVVMMHLEVDAKALQAVTPFQLDLWNGRAFVSLVAFTLRGMHPRFGGRFAKCLFSPLATHQFLNVRTYVRHEGEPGIHFLAEWLDSWLAVQLGPRVFGLPYRLGRIEYQNDGQQGELRGHVVDLKTGAALVYRAGSETGVPNFAPCTAGSLDEWLMERYTAFNGANGGARVPASLVNQPTHEPGVWCPPFRVLGAGGHAKAWTPNGDPFSPARQDSRRIGKEKCVNEARGDSRPTCRRRFFRVWHEPWPQVPVQVELADRSLLTRHWPFLGDSKLIGANFSPGVCGVWMGWPHGLVSPREPRTSSDSQAPCV